MEAAGSTLSHSLLLSLSVTVITTVQGNCNTALEFEVRAHSLVTGTLRFASYIEPQQHSSSSSTTSHTHHATICSECISAHTHELQQDQLNSITTIPCLTPAPLPDTSPPSFPTPCLCSVLHMYACACASHTLSQLPRSHYPPSERVRAISTSPGSHHAPLTGFSTSS